MPKNKPSKLGLNVTRFTITTVTKPYRNAEAPERKKEAPQEILEAPQQNKVALFGRVMK